MCGKSSKPSGSEEIERWEEQFGRAAWTRIGVKETHGIEGAGIGPSVLCWLGVEAEQIQFALFLFGVARANCSSDDVVCRQGRTYTGRQGTHGTKARQEVSGCCAWDACASAQAVRPQRFADKFTQIPASAMCSVKTTHH